MVEIMPYNPGWARDFEDIGATLREGLGELALRIDHIGSTSVPGLAAKDIIDVQITVARLDDRIVSVLPALGYSLAEGIWRDHHPPGSGWSESDGQEAILSRSPGTAAHPYPRAREGERQPAIRPPLS